MENISEILGLLGGVSVVVTGLIAYFGKLRLEKYKSDLHSTNQKLKTLLEQSSHVTKAQFDKEFEIYHEIWSALIPLRQHTMQLRPMLDQFDPKELEEERIRKRLFKFGEAFNVYHDLIEKNKPFYSEKVYLSLSKVLGLCYVEALDYGNKDDRNLKEYWQQQREKREIICQSIDDSCEIIRSRIESLSIIE